MMNLKKTFNIFVLLVALITIILIFSLSVAIFGTQNGVLYSLFVCIFFGGIIGFGAWSHRVKKIIKPNTADAIKPTTPVEQELEIPLIESKKSFDFNSLPLHVALIIILFILNFQFLLYEIEFNVAGIVFGINVIVIILFLSVIFFLKKDFNRKKELIHLSPERKVVLNSSGLRLPFEVLTEKAQHVALKNKEPDIFILWTDIEAWEIYPGGGRAPSQFSLTLKGDAKKYASLLGLLGIVRIPEISKNEVKIIDFAKQYLSCDITLR